MIKSCLPLLVLGLVLAACSAPEPTALPTATPLPFPTATSEAVSGVAGVTEASVTIVSQAFQPHTLIVATGTTVTWQNDDTVAHTVSSGEGWFDSSQLAIGKNFVHQFDKPGTFRYRCNNHPSMEGVVIVLPGGAVAPALFGGKEVSAAFADSCGGCHGPNREGGTGPALIPGRLTAKDDDYFDAIKNGRPGTVMPAWGSAGLSDEEIWALVGFIRSEPKAEAVQWKRDQIAASHKRRNLREGG